MRQELCLCTDQAFSATPGVRLILDKSQDDGIPAAIPVSNDYKIILVMQYSLARFAIKAAVFFVIILHSKTFALLLITRFHNMPPSRTLDISELPCSPTRYNQINPVDAYMSTFEPGKDCEVDGVTFNAAIKFTLSLKDYALDNTKSVNARLDAASLYAINVIGLIARLVRYCISFYLVLNII